MFQVYFERHPSFLQDLWHEPPQEMKLLRRQREGEH
jgi:hypothetical protein